MGSAREISIKEIKAEVFVLLLMELDLFQIKLGEKETWIGAQNISGGYKWRRDSSIEMVKRYKEETS